jgi:hypothetical protein
MFVQRLLPLARGRLVTVAISALFLDVARLLRSGTDFIVVCGPEEAIAGVITKTDVMRQIASCPGGCFTSEASAVMPASCNGLPTWRLAV